MVPATAQVSKVHLFIRASLVWIAIFAAAFTNGAIREFTYKPIIGEPWAHHVSVFTGCALMFAVVWFLWRKLQVANRREAYIVGTYWLIMTIFVETFLMSRLLAKQSWEQIAHNYNLLEGELWPLCLVWIFFLPLMLLKLHGNRFCVSG